MLEFVYRSQPNFEIKCNVSSGLYFMVSYTVERGGCRYHSSTLITLIDIKWARDGSLRAKNLKLRPRFTLFFWFETTVEPPYTNPHEVGNQVQRQFQDAFHGSIFSRTGDLWLPPPHSPYINRRKMGGRLMPEVEKSHTAPPNRHLLNT